MHYTPSKPLFSDKEIIFRSGGRAKVFNISSKMQIFMLLFILFVAIWSAYSYKMFHKSGKLRSKLDSTRSAYAELMSDFVAVHKNINSMFTLINEETIEDESDLDRYKQQVQVMEDRIKQITDNQDWLENEGVSKNVTVREAILERDRALSERNILVSKIKVLEENLKELENSEMEILNRIEALSSSETAKIREAISDVNQSIKKQNGYFNPLAGGKKGNSGGTFEPALPNVSNSALKDKMKSVFTLIDDLVYYREIMTGVPIGKPIWNYTVSSPFGYRSDPFNKNSAAHKGVDLASNKGNIVTTKAKGKVVRSEWVTGYGNFIEIDHENGFKTKYAHLNKSYVQKGDIVDQGQKIAEVGSTGRSTGPHLHYEVLYKGTNVDPMAFIKAQK